MFWLEDSPGLQRSGVEAGVEAGPGAGVGSCARAEARQSSSRDNMAASRQG